ncbi:hypothetical protein QSH39_000015 [Xanthomonas arboricola pv. corylina]|uniref:hypothetical protein n=1 Tax=Xanthomonas arboricola TaxID=56448 RepID=UPI0015E28796|nr:hypothetical protein [Xanthomonas arboricola]MDN0208814.1 hypothetical protein [Xanthomonas arboricola pv. corylina]MDN0213251.1 hypothetical protein [Xanthomonas arboricola pv. corylina]
MRTQNGSVPIRARHVIAVYAIALSHYLLRVHYVRIAITNPRLPWLHARSITALRIRFHRRGLHALHSRAFLRRKVVQRQQRDHRQGQSAACMTKTDTAPRYCPSCLHVHPSRPGRGTIAIASPDNK